MLSRAKEILAKAKERQLVGASKRVNRQKKLNKNFGAVKGGTRYVAMVNKQHVGSSFEQLVTKCIRNLYVIDNNIQDDVIHEVGMTVE